MNNKELHKAMLYGQIELQNYQIEHQQKVILDCQNEIIKTKTKISNLENKKQELEEQAKNLNPNIMAKPLAFEYFLKRKREDDYTVYYGVYENNIYILYVNDFIDKENYQGWDIYLNNPREKGIWVNGRTQYEILAGYRFSEDITLIKANYDNDFIKELKTKIKDFN